MPRTQAQAELLQIAEALLQGTFVPELQKLPDQALRRGAYVLDLFTRLLPLEATRKHALRGLLDRLWQQLSAVPTTPSVAFYPDDAAGHDTLAHHWGLANGLRPAHVPGLLDLQRRACT
jgi:hypothetical protein